MSAPDIDDEHPRRRGITALRRTAVVAVTTVALLTAGGIAFAAWSSSGAGNASAKAGSALPPTTTQVADAALTSGLLYPGGTGSAQISITNPNPYSVKVSSVAAGAAASVKTPGAPGATCTTTGVTFSPQAPNTTISANTTVTLVMNNAVSMDVTSDTGCQNAVFTIPVTVTIISG